MSSVANVVIHRSQFPENVRNDLYQSLNHRKVNHKFHYDSFRQTQKWLALHEAYSPARTDADCLATYDAAFVATARKIAASEVHLIGLGCGGGQKDTRLLELMRDAGKTLSYTPSDVSVAMVLVAREAALSVVEEGKCRPFVCDLATADDLASALDAHTGKAGARLITFFGMIPNFEPEIILPRLAGLVRAEDYLLFSANLAPGADYSAGVRQVLPLYDNPLTRDWLMAFLEDFGVGQGDGEMIFGIEDTANGLKRIAADFVFSKSVIIRLDGKEFKFGRGENIRLFFSYRHTPALIREMLAKYQLQVDEEWITQSGEEGVFLCRRPGSRSGIE